MTKLIKIKLYLFNTIEITIKTLLPYIKGL